MLETAHMKRMLTIAALTGGAAMTLSCSGDEPAAPDEADIATAREAATALETELKSRLMAAMNEGGPAAAIRVCSEEAPEIAGQVSASYGMSVGRTALRIRNPGNAPDAWERAQLEHFSTALAEGGDPAAFEAAEIVPGEEGAHFRWAKPIVLQGPCAMCHGESVSPEIKALIAETYPDDAATGFAVGELRGMFTVQKNVH